MTIIPNSLVVASDEAFSFMVPLEEVGAAIAMSVVPDDFMADDQTGNPQVRFVADSLRGIKIKETRTTAAKEVSGLSCVRVMFVHDKNPNSTVRLEAKK